MSTMWESLGFSSDECKWDEDCGSQSLPSQILPFLYLGAADHSARRKCIDTLNIRFVMNCAIDCMNHFEKDPQMSYLHIKVSDFASARISEHFETAFAFIENAKKQHDEAVAAGNPKPPTILIHCMAGISRSATIVIMYLMRTQHLKLSEALRQVKLKRQIVSPNQGFIAQLSILELRLGISSSHDFLDTWSQSISSLCTRAKALGASHKSHMALAMHYLIQLEQQEMAIEMISSVEPEVLEKKRELLKLLQECKDALNPRSNQ